MVWWRSSRPSGAAYETHAGASGADDGGQLYSLKYGSVLTEPENADATLAAIMASALKNNPALEISGMMYYDRRTQELCQILEGPRHRVLALYEVIANDQRHQRRSPVDTCATGPPGSPQAGGAPASDEKRAVGPGTAPSAPQRSRNGSHARRRVERVCTNEVTAARG